jgi:hypothetical protein
MRGHVNIGIANEITCQANFHAIYYASIVKVILRGELSVGGKPIFEEVVPRGKPLFEDSQRGSHSWRMTPLLA